MKAMVLWVAVMVLPIHASAQEIYRWVDEKGTIHFADDLTLVPERYRNQIEKRAPARIPSLSSGSPQVAPESTRSIAEPTSEKKDMLGREEAWWRAKMKEWNEKLQGAQRNIDLLSSDLRQKEKELADAKFKSDFIKRRLKEEIKDIEGKLKIQERLRDEAKNMIEKILPKEAEDFRADPDWLKPKD